MFSPRWPGYAASSRRIAILSCLPTGSPERDKVTVQSQVINFTTTQGTLSHQTPQSFKHNTPLVISHKAPCKWQGQNNRGMQGARPAPYNHRHTGEISLIAQIIMRESVCVQKVRWDIFFCFISRSPVFPHEVSFFFLNAYIQRNSISLISVMHQKHNADPVREQKGGRAESGPRCKNGQVLLGWMLTARASAWERISTCTSRDAY